MTMKLLLPELTITDADGRFIVISPRQFAILGSRLEKSATGCTVTSSPPKNDTSHRALQRAAVVGKGIGERCEEIHVGLL